MIKIKAPIELKSAKTIVSATESFGQRIMGNYELMSARIEREDLLHVVTSPPEVYIGGQESASIIQDTRIQNNRQTKLEVINNLLNRISVTEEVNLTYQDRVYITDVLQRLGVVNVSQFMKQLSLLKQETRNVRELTDLYLNHLEELNRTMEEHQHISSGESRVQENYNLKERLFLHEDILNRLQTGAVYQILNNFYSRPVQDSARLSGQELTFSEQQRAVSHILLNRLQTQTVGRAVPFVYRHENFYEENQSEETLVTRESVNSQITSAILLHLADSLYQSLSEKNIRGSQVWVHVENALYQAAENTLKRLSYSLSGQSADREVHRETQTREMESQEREMETLRELLSFTARNEQVFLENRSGIPADIHVTDQTLEPVALSYPETAEEEKQETFLHPSLEPKKGAETVWERQTPAQEPKRVMEDFFLPPVSEGRNKEQVWEINKRKDRRDVPALTFPGKEAALLQEKEGEGEALAESAPALSPEKRGESYGKAEAVLTAPGVRTREREAEFERLLNQYLSVVYRQDSHAEVTISPMELSLRQDSEADDQTPDTGARVGTTSDTKAAEEFRPAADFPEQSPSLLPRERAGQEEHPTYHAGEREGALSSEMEKIREIVREERFPGEKGAAPARENSINLVFSEQKTAEGEPDTERSGDRAASKTDPEAADRRSGGIPGEKDSAKGSEPGETSEMIRISERKEILIPDQIVRDGYALLPQSKQEVEGQEASSAGLELTYRTEEEKGEEKAQAPGKPSPHAKPEESRVLKEEARQAQETLQSEEEKKEKALAQAVLQAFEKRPEREKPEGQPGQELSFVNGILHQRISETAPGQASVLQIREPDQISLIYQQGDRTGLEKSQTVPMEAGESGQTSAVEEKDADRDSAQMLQITSERILKQIEEQRQGVAAKAAADRAESEKTGAVSVRQEMSGDGGQQPLRREEESLHLEERIPSVDSGDTYHTVSSMEETNLYYAGQQETEEEAYAALEPDEASLMEQLQEINRRNIENYQRYQQLLAARREEEGQAKTDRKPAVLKMREESLKALENPQLVAEERLKREKLKEAGVSSAEQAMEELIPEETRVLYEKVRQMQQARLNAPDQGVMEQNSSLQELILDIRRTEQESRTQTRELHESQRELHDTTERVMEQRREYETVSSSPGSRMSTEQQNLSLVHKSLENLVDEEELMELLEQNRFLQKNVNVTNRVEESRREENVTVRQQTSSTRYEQKEDIEGLIQRGVQRQMGLLSDQIYTKLERRLENEKKRRGY